MQSFGVRFGKGNRGGGLDAFEKAIQMVMV